MTSDERRDTGSQTCRLADWLAWLTDWTTERQRAGKTAAAKPRGKRARPVLCCPALLEGTRAATPSHLTVAPAIRQHQPTAFIETNHHQRARNPLRPACPPVPPSLPPARPPLAALHLHTVRPRPLQLPCPRTFAPSSPPTRALHAWPSACRCSAAPDPYTDYSAQLHGRSHIPRCPMAQGSRGPATATMPSNGTTPHPSAPGAVNRKKQKRREKEAAKKAAQDPPPPATTRNGVSGGPNHSHHSHQSAPQYADAELDDPPYDEDPEFYSDDEVEHYEHPYGTNGHYQQGYSHAPVPSGSTKKSRKKKKGASAPPPPPPPLAYSQHAAPRHVPAQNHSTARSGAKKDRIWNTSTAEERERIREFWLSLGEDDRKSLVKIEKEAVLRKMKEQQKHSCSCSVCGRKRTAIEEELEVLYDAYYEELEQYAHHQQDVSRFLPDANFRHAFSAPHPRPLMNTHPPPGHYEDDEDEDYSEDDYSHSEVSSEVYDSEEAGMHPHETSDFLHFGSSLQVKGVYLLM